MSGQLSVFARPSSTEYRRAGHAGQRRFHDYPKLRELHQKRMEALLGKKNNRLYSYGAFASTQRRTFFNLPSLRPSTSSNESALSTTSSMSSSFLQNPFHKAMKDMQLKRLERTANSNPNDPHAQYAFLTELATEYPNLVIARMRHPQFKHHAIDVNCAVLFLNAVLKTNQVTTQFDMDDIIKRLAASARNNGAYLGSLSPASLADFQSDVALQKLSKREQLQQLLNLLTSTGAVAGSTAGMASAAAATGRFATGAASMPLMTRGLNPNAPLHITVIPREAAGGGLRSLGAVFLRCGLMVAGFAFLANLLEEYTKDIGKSLGLGGSKHVQESDGTAHKSVKFDDVKGVAEAKAELEEIVMYLKDPTKFTRLGGTLPRGVLLTGPPGTGKTLLAKAIAGEADVPFFYASGSQFEEMYVGLGAKRIRELFEAAQKKAPAIIFIDEIDAVGGKRNQAQQSHSKMTLNELLVQLDGFEDNNGIIVVAATNMKSSLDEALLRPGRFDKHVVVPTPDVGGRREILELYAKKMKLDKDVDLDVLARGTRGMTGADLFNLLNQAALKASTEGLNAITMSILEFAKDNILMGVERKTAVTTAKTARETAYHEAGHALVGVLTSGGQEVHKATIVRRGDALGLVAWIPKADDPNMTYEELVALMDMAMAGRVAEELVFGKEEISAGASSDIMYASNIARAMVATYGFSDAVGLVDYGDYESASEGTRQLIDAEVKRMIDEAYERAKTMLSKYSYEHKLLAETLLEYESLTGDEVRDVVLKRQKPKRPVINTRGGARGDTSILRKPASKADDRPPKEGTSLIPGMVRTKTNDQ